MLAPPTPREWAAQDGPASGKLGLTVDQKNTRLAHLPVERFDSLRYIVARSMVRRSLLLGKPAFGQVDQAMSTEVHNVTISRWNALDVQTRIEQLNPPLQAALSNSAKPQLVGSIAGSTITSRGVCESG